MKKNENNNVEVAVAIGVGALAAGALGYFLAGPNGKKHRKDVKSWMVKFQGDLMEKLEDAKEVTAPMYAQIVDEVGARYKGLKNIDPVELANEIALLKKRWDSLAKNKKAAKKAVKKIAKKAVKKVATKVVKKVAAK